MLRLWRHHHCWISVMPQHQPLCQQQLLQHLLQLLPFACLLLLAARTRTDSHTAISVSIKIQSKGTVSLGYQKTDSAQEAP